MTEPEEHVDDEHEEEEDDSDEDNDEDDESGVSGGAVSCWNLLRAAPTHRRIDLRSCFFRAIKK